MMVRTQISLDSEEHRLAKRRAEALGISLAAYVRKLIRSDNDEGRPAADISDLFGLGDSGGSDIASGKDDYLGDAVEQQHLSRSAGRRP